MGNDPALFFLLRYRQFALLAILLMAAGIAALTMSLLSGTIEDTIPIPGVNAGFYGIYGAAVDTEGNFWGSQLSIGSLVRVDRGSFDYEVWPMALSGYGMTVDHLGQVWTCSYSVCMSTPGVDVIGPSLPMKASCSRGPTC